MSDIIPGDLFQVTSGVIAHQVNCKGAFGAGLAKEIAKRYSKVQVAYFRKHHTSGWQLGEVQFVELSPQLVFANCASQDDFRRSNSSKLPFTNYESMRHCFRKVKTFSEEHRLQVYLPFKYGCGLGGGNWIIVLQIIEEELPDAKVIQLVCES